MINRYDIVECKTLIKQIGVMGSTPYEYKVFNGCALVLINFNNKLCKIMTNDGKILNVKTDYLKRII